MPALFKQTQIFTGNYFSHIKHFEPTMLHKHDFFEFFYISAGTCTHLINGKHISLSAGDAMLLTPNDAHTFLESSPNSKLTHRDILFSCEHFQTMCNSLAPDLYSKILEKKFVLSFRLSNEQIMSIEDQILTITVSQSKDVSSILINALTSYILNCILNATYHSQNIPNWVVSLISYFNDPLYFSFPLVELTGRFQLDHSYMCRKFKQYTATTMSDYFNKEKIIYAHTLLQSTNFSIEEICELSGISSPSYFYRLYKKYYGKTPRKALKT